MHSHFEGFDIWNSVEYITYCPVPYAAVYTSTI